MRRERPEVLAVRSVNQYRRRDVLTYLGLRYYLHNTAARSDDWARKVATELVLTRTERPYFRSYHFKERADDGGVEHRVVYLPGANEALAEAAMLAECADRAPFANPSCVYSYSLTRGGDRSGVFQHYFEGLQARQEAIGKACDACPTGIVHYTDIKRFYPSISPPVALTAWQEYADLAELPGRYRALGERLVSDHGQQGDPAKSSILTGPMFSHLVGNLVLRELDDEFCASLPAKYFRYVDDIVLVGEQQDVANSLTLVRSRLADSGFTLHDDDSPKSFSTPTTKWIEARNDFSRRRGAISWMTLIGDLKRFLLSNPDRRNELRTALSQEGFRLPVRDYSEAARESTAAERVLQLARRAWFRRKSQRITVETLLHQARWLREAYERGFVRLAEGAEALTGFDRKRRIPRLRFNLGRLIYLGTEDALGRLLPLAAHLPELHFHAQIMKTVITGNIDPVLRLGSNAAQGAAQPLRAAGKKASTTLVDLSAAEEQALAVFYLNGVQVSMAQQQHAVSELMQFATAGVDRTLMRSQDSFMREMACLHGLSDQPRHPELLETVFDEDEELVMDAIEQLQQSVSG